MADEVQFVPKNIRIVDEVQFVPKNIRWGYKNRSQQKETNIVLSEFTYNSLSFFQSE